MILDVYIEGRGIHSPARIFILHDWKHLPRIGDHVSKSSDGPRYLVKDVLLIDKLAPRIFVEEIKLATTKIRTDLG